MEEFFRFPSTPHLAWLSDTIAPREDKLLSISAANALLAQEVVVEEKIDGANIGISIAEGGKLQFQNRGHFLTEPYVGQFARLQDWITQHADGLCNCIDERLILFGEWCAAKHTIGYSRLPDWFLLFDVYDRELERFWSSSRRNALAAAAGIQTVPTLLQGQTNLSELKEMVTGCLSRYGYEPIEGVVVRRENADWCEVRAKLVRAGFIQKIGEHWSRRHIIWNRVDWTGG